MKYRVTAKVHGFRYKGHRYATGEVVDLPPEVYIPPFLEPYVEGVPVKAPAKKNPMLAESLEDIERQDLVKALEEKKVPEIEFVLATPPAKIENEAKANPATGPDATLLPSGKRLRKVKADT